MPQNLFHHPSFIPLLFILLSVSSPRCFHSLFSLFYSLSFLSFSPLVSSLPFISCSFPPLFLLMLISSLLLVPTYLLIFLLSSFTSSFSTLFHSLPCFFSSLFSPFLSFSPLVPSSSCQYYYTIMFLPQFVFLSLWSLSFVWIFPPSSCTLIPMK